MLDRRPLLVLLLLCSMGCGVGFGPPKTVTPQSQVSGTIGGEPVSQSEVMLAELLDERSRVGTLRIEIAGTTGLCDKAKADQQTKNTAGLVISLQNGKGDTLNPGVYPVFAGEHLTGTEGNYSTGTLYKRDATCAETLTGTRKFASGSVELKTYSEGGSVTGTFDVTVDGQSYQGSFAANTCQGVTQTVIDAADTCI